MKVTFILLKINGKNGKETTVRKSQNNKGDRLAKRVYN